MQDHRRLRVWKKAVGLAVNVRDVAAHYPARGYSELKAQTISAAESVVFTIVEGCGASAQREFARFLEMAIKSSKELEAELELAALYEILPARQWESLTTEVVDIRRMLVGLRKKVLATPDRRIKPLNAPPPHRPPDPSRSISHSQRTTDNTTLPSRAVGPRRWPAPLPIARRLQKC
ncbi:MAG: four helix bundle protein [Gemmatimonadaceae bacterium]